MAETAKARARREREGFFEKYCQGKGIDIGVGRLNCGAIDPVTPDAFPWDIDNGDATYLTGIQDADFDWVYSSHCLEHLSNPVLALMNWWRILRPGGHLILYVPHRDLYERRKTLPSRWADGESWESAMRHGHKFYILPDRNEAPHTLSLMGLLRCTDILGQRDTNLVYMKVDDEGYVYDHPLDAHPLGNYSIEVVLKKPLGVDNEIYEKFKETQGQISTEIRSAHFG